MTFIILAGGTGERLWPLSTLTESKPFVKILKTDDDKQISIFQSVYKSLKKIDQNANIVIAANQNHKDIIKEQLNIDTLSLEPAKKDTFAAILLSVLYSRDILKLPENESVVVLPCDMFVDKSYYQSIKKLYDLSTQSDGLTLLGIKPTYPSTQYGYIIPKDKTEVSTVLEFKEKPNTDEALKYIKHNALWNAGVFAFKIKYLQDKAKKYYSYTNYNDLLNNYEKIDKFNFSYEIVEKEKDLQVLTYNGLWSDVGTWDELLKYIDINDIGKVVKDNCKNTSIINMNTTPIICSGIDNSLVVSSHSGTLVINKNNLNDIKKCLKELSDAN